MKIRKGDNVQVTTGKYKGTKSTVEKVLPNKGKVLVKDVNTVIRHVKQQEGQGGRISVEKPIDVSNIALICPKCEKKTRIGFEVQGNKKVRVCKKCSEQI